MTKHLVLVHFLAAGRGRLDPRERSWLRHHLFEKGDYVDDDPAIADRYRQAARGAVQFIDGLPADARNRLIVLRRFHDVDVAGKYRLIAA
ncbi:MAG: hypothetical protein GTN89_09520 [Acidobacteria bacterium]|nr:hypothetical protein [Acidobacteriota bacterium]NIM60918.1 hypothetical protein [Acidobacteriota bacterium]NIQ30591.1 hypothetical protein [Acidobacteriota bacterium]NIQ85557.1 hypothetical protein [Acidobacteriota bacterium]NIT11277.1 hypothetical protein [Acidobacteriota bacterium]